MSDAFAIARRLRETPDDALRELLRERRIVSPKIGDFFDLAEALLDEQNISRVLTLQDRNTLAVLVAASRTSTGGAGGRPATRADLVQATGLPEDVVRDAVGTAERLLLVTTVDGADDASSPPSDAVVPVAPLGAVFAAWPAQGLPSADELLRLAAAAPTAQVSESGPEAGEASPSEAPPSADHHPGPGNIDQATIDQIGAERATLGVGVLAESMHELAKDPARQLGRGAPSMPDLKRMAAAANSTTTQVELILQTAADAGLTLVVGGYIRVSEAGESWLSSTVSERWRFLATAWLSSIPETFRSRAIDAYLSGTADLQTDLAAWYPAGAETLKTAAGLVQAAGELLGVSVEGTTTTPARRLLLGEDDAAEQALAALLPAEVSQVVLQDDLTVIALGPPEASLDAKLRLIADPEGRAQASRYRFTSATIARALADGESAQSLLDYLRSVSLTGIPQPLQYLITEAEHRFGRVRVGLIGASDDGSAEAGRVSYVRSEDAGMIAAISVDQGLGPLGLRHTDQHRLASRLSPETVYWALHDAKYPVIAEDEHGAPIQIRRQAPARTTDVSPAATAPDLVARLRDGDAGDTGRAWLSKQLEIAVRDHTPVTVSVVFGDRAATFTLEPTSLSAGRLRGLDRAADVERTLPLSTITEVLAAR
ncbi:helicase-associated domain-containing protein [Plantibacter sp. Mn2098]|uniref:helicase-associated domain-containing protein n=1 Tax=Plantibacter sp. Mn2098 TaxID=3395266 RepID=UPI003BD4683A